MSGQPGPQDDEAARLEAALDRIARATARRQVANANAAAHQPTTPETADIAARLDQLIADLRGLLGS